MRLAVCEGMKTLARSLVILVLIPVLGLIPALVSSHAQASERGSPAATSSGASRSHGSFGLGLVLGEPSGLSAKYWSGSSTAWDAGLAYSFNDYLLIWADHLWHFSGALTKLSSDFDTITPYVGVGPEVFISSLGTRKRGGVHDGRSAGLAARVPLGLEWTPRKVPIGVFLELVPGLDLIPALDAFFEGGIGARFYFD